MNDDGGYIIPSEIAHQLTEKNHFYAKIIVPNKSNLLVSVLRRKYNMDNKLDDKYMAVFFSGMIVLSFIFWCGSIISYMFFSGSWKMVAMWAVIYIFTRLAHKFFYRRSNRTPSAK